MSIHVFKNILLFSLLCLTFLFKSQAQAGLQDSLLFVIANTKEIKTKIDALNRYGFELRNKKRDSSKILAMQGLLFSKQISYSTGIGESYYLLGTYYYLRNNDSSLFYFKHSVSAYKTTEPGLLRMARSYNGLLNAFVQSGKYDSAIYHGYLALDYVSTHKDTGVIKKERLMYCYGSLANTYYYAGNYDSSIQYYLKATMAAEKLNGHGMLTSYYMGIANIYATEKEYTKAIIYGRKSADACWKAKDFESLVLTTLNIGGYYNRMDSFEMAKLYVDSSLEIAKRNKIETFTATSYSTRGSIEMNLKNCIKALYYFKEGLNFSSQSNESEFQRYVLFRKIGEAYACQDSILQAKENYFLALKLGEGDIDHQSDCYMGLSAVCLANKDFKEAYEYLKLANNLRDSVFSSEKTKIISELTTKFETEKKEQQVIILSNEKLLQQKEIAQQQQQIITSALLAKEQQQLIALGKLSFEKQEQQIKIRDLTLENNQSELQKQQLTITSTSNKLKAELQEKEIQAAIISRQKSQFLLLFVMIFTCSMIAWLFFNRYKLNKKIESQQVLINERGRISRELHDEVGATLSGISMYSHLTKEQIKQSNFTEVEKSVSVMQQSAGEMVNKLNDIVWLINPEQDSLQKLVQRLEEYAGEIAMIKKMLVKVTVPANLYAIQLPIEHRRNIYLFCKEAINNAVKYSNASMLDLTIRESGDQIEFSLTDNGKGFDAATVKRGNGLNNMQKRADEIGGLFTIRSKHQEGSSLSLQIKIT